LGVGIESGIITKKEVEPDGRLFYYYVQAPHRYERVPDRVLIILGMNGPLTAYRVAQGCKTGFSSTKKTLNMLRRSNLVQVTARATIESTLGLYRTRAEAWDLTRRGLERVLNLASSQDWMIDRIAQRHILQASSLYPPARK